MIQIIIKRCAAVSFDIIGVFNIGLEKQLKNHDPLPTTLLPKN